MDIGSAEYTKILWPQGCWLSWASHNILCPWILAQLSNPKYYDAMYVGSAEQATNGKILWCDACWTSWVVHNIVHPTMFPKLSSLWYYFCAEFYSVGTYHVTIAIFGISDFFRFDWGITCPSLSKSISQFHTIFPDMVMFIMHLPCEPNKIQLWNQWFLAAQIHG